MMISKKLILVSMSLVLCTPSLCHASDQRQMDRQRDKVLMKKSRYQAHKYREDLLARKQPIQLNSSIKASNPVAIFLIVMLLSSHRIEGVHALDNNPPSIQSAGNGKTSRSVSESDCLVTSEYGHCTSQPADFILGKVGLKNSDQFTRATASGLANIFCPPFTEGQQTCVTMSGDEVTFVGTEQQVDNIIQKLENFDSLRDQVIPTSPAAAKTQAHPDSQFNNWYEVETSLGVEHETLKNMAFSDDTAQQLIAINYEKSEAGRKSFNQRTADAYIDTLKEESMFLKFLADRNKNLVTYADKHMVINYGLFNEYFSRLNLKKMQQNDGTSSITILLDSVLKRLMAAVSGEVSLEKSLRPGEFHVRTVNVGDELSPDEKQSTPPIVEIIIDTSGSMCDKPINTVNRNLPKLLQDFTNTLEESDLLKINIYSLSHRFDLWQSFDLDKNFDISRWADMECGGGTDLTPIGIKLKIEAGETPNKVVVAFTDGEHNYGSSLNYGPPLDETYYDSLRELQESGAFAQPFLCKVGYGSEDFFKDIAAIFSGSYSKEHTTEECWKRVSAAIPDLLESKAPLVLTISGNNQVIWLSKSQDGIQTTTQTVQARDEIVLGNFRATIALPETKDEKRARLQAELAALED